jgi:hypothetical protein
MLWSVVVEEITPELTSSGVSSRISPVGVVKSKGITREVVGVQTKVTKAEKDGFVESMTCNGEFLGVDQARTKDKNHSSDKSVQNCDVRRRTRRMAGASE